MLITRGIPVTVMTMAAVPVTERTSVDEWRRFGVSYTGGRSERRPYEGKGECGIALPGGK